MVQEVRRCTPPKKTNMAMEKQAFEDVSPIKNRDFPLPFLGGVLRHKTYQWHLRRRLDY